MRVAIKFPIEVSDHARHQLNREHFARTGECLKDHRDERKLLNAICHLAIAGYVEQLDARARAEEQEATS